MKKSTSDSTVAMMIVLAAAVAINILLPSIAVAAKAYSIGDNNGWRPGVDYQAWVANKVFDVSDALVFRYVGGEDHVYEVDEASFQRCRIPAGGSGRSGSGIDIVILRSVSQKWFIGDHCREGEKLVINVFDPFGSLPCPPTTSTTSSCPIISSFNLLLQPNNNNNNNNV